MKRLLLGVFLGLGLAFVSPVMAQDNDDDTVLPFTSVNQRATLFEVDYIAGPWDRLVFDIKGHQFSVMVSDATAESYVNHVQDMLNPPTEFSTSWKSAGQVYSVSVFQGPYEPIDKTVARFQAAVTALKDIFPPDPPVTGMLNTGWMYDAYGMPTPRLTSSQPWNISTRRMVRAAA